MPDLHQRERCPTGLSASRRQVLLTGASIPLVMAIVAPHSENTPAHSEGTEAHHKSSIGAEQIEI